LPKIDFVALVPISGSCDLASQRLNAFAFVNGDYFAIHNFSY
jgi:hypothetical protein